MNDDLSDSVLEARLSDLRQDHADLDAAVAAISATPMPDMLLRVWLSVLPNTWIPGDPLHMLVSCFVELMPDEIDNEAAEELRSQEVSQLMQD